MRRIISTILAIVMAISILPISIFAVDGEETDFSNMKITYTIPVFALYGYFTQYNYFRLVLPEGDDIAVDFSNYAVTVNGYVSQAVNGVHTVRFGENPRDFIDESNPTTLSQDTVVNGTTSLVVEIIGDTALSESISIDSLRSDEFSIQFYDESGEITGSYSTAASWNTTVETVSGVQSSTGNVPYEGNTKIIYTIPVYGLYGYFTQENHFTLVLPEAEDITSDFTNYTVTINGYESKAVNGVHTVYFGVTPHDYIDENHPATLPQDTAVDGTASLEVIITGNTESSGSIVAENLQLSDYFIRHYNGDEEVSGSYSTAESWNVSVATESDTPSISVTAYAYGMNIYAYWTAYPDATTYIVVLINADTNTGISRTVSGTSCALSVNAAGNYYVMVKPNNCNTAFKSNIVTAEAPSGSGTCGDNLTWTLTDDGTLTISGTGDMYDYNWVQNENGSGYVFNAPWYSYANYIKNIVINEGVTSISQNAFLSCSATAFSIPSSVTSIGYSALPHSLSVITLAEGNESFVISDSILFTKDMSELVYYGGGKTDTEYTVPSTVAVIRPNAIVNYNLKTLNIPVGVTTLNGAISSPSLTEINVADDNPNYCDIDGVLYNKAVTQLISYPNLSAITDYVMPSTVITCNTIIINGQNLNSITLSEKLYSFTVSYNPNLTKITVLNPNTNLSLSYATQNTPTIYGYDNSTAQTFAETNSFPFVSMGEAPIIALASGTCGDGITWLLSTDYTLTVSGTGHMYDYTPGSAPWYSYANAIKRVVIQEGLYTIGSYSFYNCAQLQSVEIPNGVEYIAESAFRNCYLLECVNLPASLIGMGINVFFQCIKLNKITVDEDNQYYTSIDGVLFNKDTSVLIKYPSSKVGTEYVLPDGVKIIRTNAFLQAVNLKSITLPSTLTVIENLSFQYCGIESIEIPSSVASVEENAFKSCQNLETVTFSSPITEIYSNEDTIPSAATIHGYNGSTAEAYAEKYNRTFVSLGEAPITTLASGTCGDNLTWALTNYGTLTISGAGEMYDYGWVDDEYLYAPWYDYRSLIKTGVIEEGVTSIGDQAFLSCQDLINIMISDSVTSIGEDAFHGCYGLTNIFIPDGVTSIGGYAFSVCSSLTSITIPDSVTSIGNHAFSYCTSLTSITIPDSITSMGINPLCGCSSLTEIIVDENNQHYADIDGVLFDKNYTELICYPNGKVDTSYAIPNSVTRISDEAFNGCSNLTSITIPDSVTSIGYAAFSECSSLISITIPDGVTFIFGALYGCSSLTNVTFLSSFTVIPDGEYSIPSSATIYGYEGSTAQAYAEKYSRTFVSMGEAPEEEIPTGNINGDDKLDKNDALHLLYHTLFPEDYPVTEECDYNDDGVVDRKDALYLLYHAIFGAEMYPLI